jgi:diguanylate cyclase (GGDEF)-like protein
VDSKKRSASEVQSVAGPGEVIRVKKSSSMSRLCVLTLEAGGVGPTFRSVFAELASGPAQVVVIDCLDLAVIPESMYAELIHAHEQLGRGERQLLVVNAPAEARGRLGSHGVDVAVTMDAAHEGGAQNHDDQDEHSLSLEVAAAAAERDTAVALRDQLESGNGGEELAQRLALARARAEASQDRFAAAIDRLEAASYLELTYRDDLTGALQRRAGADQLDREIARSHRTADPLVVAFIDVDHLKSVNDQLGHAAGDRLLATVGRALRNGLRSYDLVIRYGGDEFVCALAGVTLENTGRRLAEAQTWLASAWPGAAISVGLARLEPGDDLDAVVRRADLDLYRRRAAGPRH